MDGSRKDEQLLSLQDKAILHSIFNPNEPFDENEDIQEKSATQTEEEDSKVESPTAIEAKRLETEGVKAAEKGDLLLALDFFNRAIEVEPGNASGFNNRAQVLRLQGDTAGALEDLNKAIELSQGKGKAACQAFSQRAMIKRLEGHEESALEDFKKAAALGSSFAKQQVVALNPYAALCNQMLAEVIGKIKRGEDV